MSKGVFDEIVDRIIDRKGKAKRQNRTLLAVSDPSPDSETMEIVLVSGEIALVDKADYENLAGIRWYATSGKGTTYAQQVFPNGESVTMHRTIMEPPDGFEVHHINHNGLDNRRSNLRNVTRSENLRNRRAYAKSGHKGVAFNKANGKWKANLHLGNFDTPEEASKAYEDARKKVWGE